MRSKSFISQLKDIQDKFLKYAKENSTKVNKNTFEINICNRYLLLRIECEDEYEDTIVFTQEVEIDYDKTYQNDLIPSTIHTEY